MRPADNLALRVYENRLLQFYLLKKAIEQSNPPVKWYGIDLSKMPYTG